MTVPTDLAYVERAWTGVESSFTTGIRALDAAHHLVRYRTAAGLVLTLTPAVHYTPSLVAKQLVFFPLSLPAAPGTLLIERVTPATQLVNFLNLAGNFDPETHENIADEAAMRSAEDRRKLGDLDTPVSDAEAAALAAQLALSRARGWAAQAIGAAGQVFSLLGQVQNLIAAAQAGAVASIRRSTAAFSAMAEGAANLARTWASEAQNRSEETHAAAGRAGAFGALSQFAQRRAKALAGLVAVELASAAAHAGAAKLWMRRAKASADLVAGQLSSVAAYAASAMLWMRRAKAFADFAAMQLASASAQAAGAALYFRRAKLQATAAAASAAAAAASAASMTDDQIALKAQCFG